MNADSYGLKLNEQSSEQTVYDYNMLMSAMNVSVSKHLMDENFTVVWANDYFTRRLYTQSKSMKRSIITAAANILSSTRKSMKKWRWQLNRHC